MAVLELILVLFLQFEGVRGRDVFVYYRPGSDAILPCNRASSSGAKCTFSWLYNRDPSRTISEVNNGHLKKTSARAARLSLSSNCSLIINNITADDVGQYTCRHGRTTELDTFVYLNILTISPSPPEADPKRDGYVTLECSMLRYERLPDCLTRSIRWVDETGAELDGEEVRYELGGQKICVSTLTVKHQSGNNRRYTCQYVERNSVKIEAHYTPVFTDAMGPSDSAESTHWSALSYFMLLLQIIGLILFIVITVLIIRHKGSKKPLEDKKVHDDDAYADDTPNYENEASARH